MQLFNELGDEIETLWRDANYNEELFPAIAADALKRARLSEKVSAWEVLEWTLRQDELPRQKDVSGRFGDPPVTLFTAPRFYIDVYFWIDGTTSIHQHSFCGAFQVLLGSSIHSWYEFERSESINFFTEIGEIKLKLCSLLEMGDVQEIRAGRQYIHSLFHLDRPSATIVVRTGESPLFLPQFSYHKPYLALDPFFEHATTTKKLHAISALLRLQHPDIDRLITELLEKSDFQTAFSILTALHGRMQSNNLEQLFNVTAAPGRFERFLETVRRRHGEKAGIFAEVFAHKEMENDIVRKRNFITDPEHRFFFALLLNLEGKEHIFPLIKQRFPECDPLEKVLDWTFDLAQTRIAGARKQNALGFETFDDVDLSLLEKLLRDKTVEEIRSDVREEYKAEKLEKVLREIDARIAKIDEAVIFRPLLAGRRLSLSLSIADGDVRVP
ncbi:MAG: hypothetical protein H7070_07990 [Saprospiraceae bacterium]|nr:hypothetical protein [Pyrinomonadaceae bacterium]